MFQNCCQTLTDSINMNTAKSNKSCNESSRDNACSRKNSKDFTPKEHFRTSTPLENTNHTQDNKLIENMVEHIISQDTSQINQKESKLISNLFKKNDLDNINLESQEEELIIKVANKNKKHFLQLDLSQVNTQEFSKLNVDMATRNVQVYNTQFDSSKKEIVKNIDSDKIKIVLPKFEKSKNSRLRNKNEETCDKTKNVMYNTTICTNDFDQDSETDEETQFQNSKSSHTQFNTSKKEIEKNMDSDDMIVVSSPALTERLKYSKESIKNKETSSNMTNLTYNTKFGTIDVDRTQGRKSSKQGTKYSKEDQNSELVSFQSMCEELMLKTKSIIDTDNEACNDKVIGFTQLNADVLKCTSYTNCVSSTNKIKSAFDSAHRKISNSISKPLFTNSNVNLKRKMPKLSENTNESSQVQYDSLNKKLKLTSLHNTLTMHPESISNQPNISSSVNYVVTSSEDEDDSVLTKKKLPNVQNTLTNNFRVIQHDSTEAKKHFKKVKPIFTCSPYGQIHKDMLNSIEKAGLNK